MKAVSILSLSTCSFYTFRSFFFFYKPFKVTSQVLHLFISSKSD